MSVIKIQFQLLYEWLVSALFFWVFLACLETIIASVLKGCPSPLGTSSLPSAIDIRYLIAALSIYSLLSVPTALILFGAEKLFSWLKGKTKASFLDVSQMDIYLLLGFGLLFFKWISNLMPYLMETDHLPKTPYLFLLPLLGVQLWLSGLFEKNRVDYRTQWIIVFLGTFYLSKTAHSVFMSSSLSTFTRVALAILFATGAPLIAVIFHNLLHRILLNRVKPKLAYALFFVIFLFGGCLFTFNAFQTSNHSISSLQQPIKPQKGKSEITKNVIIILVDCLRADHLGCYGYRRKTSPFLDCISQSGITFENCIAPSSWTIPTVVSLFTGVYPQQHRVNEVGTIIPQSLTTLQEIMEKHGMKTAAFITNDFLVLPGILW